MPSGPDVERSARPEDVAGIDALLAAAFEGRAEADLVRRLRADGDIWLELVLPRDGVIAAYLALSRMAGPKGWACLAPLAVLPRFQNAAPAPEGAQRRSGGLGTRLVSGLVASMDSAWRGERVPEVPGDLPETLVVLGKPAFYERAGFSSARARRLTSPYPIAYTLVARPGDDAPEATLVYPPAFAALPA